MAVQLQYTLPCVTMLHVQERVQWWMEATIGDVSFKRRMGYHTSSEYLCSFSNVVQHPLPLKIPVGKLRGEECKVNFCS